MTRDIDGKQLVIAGGGLVGSLLAVFLADRGIRVTVYERQPDIRRKTEGGGRSINLVLTTRGIRALEKVGLNEAVLELTVPVMGRMIHAIDGELSYQPYGRDESECNYSISRRQLNQFLVADAERRGVRFRFESPLVEAELEAGKLVFRDERASAEVELRGAVVLGADGAASSLRSGLMRLSGSDESVEMLDHGYKELVIPIEQGRRIERNALHIWPRGDVMLMALPNLDGSFTVTLYLPARGGWSFESLDTSKKVGAFFERQFPDAVPLIPDLEEAFLENPTGELGTVKCWPWHFRDRALLLGDAAHAIVPFFGQGMNCGFEDCTVLDGTLDRHAGGGLETVFAEFARARKPNADAIADMALENFVEMRDRVGDPGFLLRKQVEHRLEQEIPLEYRSRYAMVMYTTIPYRYAFEAGLRQQAILDRLCDGLASAEALDMDRARRLIREHLTPYLQSHSIDLGSELV